MIVARKLGPQHTLCRRVGEKLCSSEKCPVARRPYPPGAHGPTQLRVKLSSYGTQLREKQKAKLVYGLLERQFRKYVDQALMRRGNTAELLIQSLERRFDNSVFRSGFAKTRAQARQWVTHGHFLVNAKKVTIPSYQIKPGDVITVKEKSLVSGPMKDVRERLEKYDAPSWLLIDKVAVSGKALEIPKGEDLQTVFDPKLIVEFYSR